MKVATKIITAVLLMILLLVPAALTMPLPQETDTPALRSELAIKLVMAVEYVGAALLFMLSLKTYKTKMRRAFSMLAGGILLTAIGAVQVPLLSAFGLSDSVWTKSGMIILPFLLAGLGIYLGIRSFARLVGLDTILTRASIVIPAALVCSVLSIFLPHVPSPGSQEIVFDMSNAIVVWTSLLNLSSALLIRHVKQRIGAHYTNAMVWLFISLVGSLVVLGVVLLRKLLIPDAPEDGIALTTVLTVIVGVAYLRAGYVFTKTEEY
jgi:hypothetical protein